MSNYDESAIMQALHEKLDRLNDDFQGHKEENMEAHESIRDELVRHYKDEREQARVIFGNGEAGIFERLRNVERFCAQATWLIKIQVAAMVLGAGAMVWELVMAYAATR